MFASLWLSKSFFITRGQGRLYRQYNYRIVDHDRLTWSTDETYFAVLMEMVMQLQKLGQYITTNSKLKQVSPVCVHHACRCPAWTTMLRQLTYTTIICYVYSLVVKPDINLIILNFDWK